MHLDLNLLVALDALLEENSVAGAADRLNLSAPAVSRTLGRIRRATGDQILVRAGRSMIPTPYALEIRGEVHELVQRARGVLRPEHHLDLANLDRAFSVRGHEAITTAIAPALLATVRDEAPGVAVRLLAEASGDTDELRHGRVDLEIGSAEPDAPEINHVTIGHDRLVAAARPGHPCAEAGLTAERLAAADHVIVSRRGRLRDPIDMSLDALGLRRRVVASVPTSTAALYLVAESELVVAVPEHMCRPLLARLGLRTRPLPFELPPVPIIMAWHQRHDDDRPHMWLRDRIREALAFYEQTAGRT
ncbi:LysR family transcriptional regulator [Actinomadura syzygii]|uniref:LysR family transcriptional regulator n=1 Tax=Actinomadura syzygii TaxID=1427538 RepID=A0A5D0TX99_9ACTN|nr:LysR family transcriptional regulator [Actinomadura syzygii]TYC09986.1 LysR family transcriptional regulator [Actinomadura syzygii]